MRYLEVIVTVFLMTTSTWELTVLINLHITTASVLQPLLVLGDDQSAWDALADNGNNSILTAEPELQRAELSKDTACPHHDVGGSSAVSKDSDCVLSCIFSQALSPCKTRAELNGVT